MITGAELSTLPSSLELRDASPTVITTSDGGLTARLAHRRERYQKNKEKLREDDRRHYRKNRDKILELGRRYSKLNRAKRTQKHARWVASNREKANAYLRQYRKDHPEKAKVWDKANYIKNHAQKLAAAKVKNRTEKAKACRERHAAMHREENRAYSVLWRKRNPGYCTQAYNKRRALIQSGGKGDDKLIRKWIMKLRKKRFIKCYW